ncbi:hypothetical protein MNB_SV-9-184 [hydrothermal vent metagenome]|uniref:Uncharacterized protein n=1 Tax=hydrothermal vent metagenome TaxID=652676 RepID=A0A1W1BR52_9ZZZZ
MSDKILDNNSYKDIINHSIKEFISLLFSLNKDFLIICETKFIDFNPELPKEIQKNFNESIVFSISGYAMETAQLIDESISFTAGFGEEDFASTITIPLLAIKQVVIDEEVVFVNLTTPKKDIVDKSMNALLNNPENKKFIRKK